MHDWDLILSESERKKEELSMSLKKTISKFYGNKSSRNTSTGKLEKLAFVFQSLKTCEHRCEQLRY